jgi:hypothetical protein
LIRATKHCLGRSPTWLSNTSLGWVVDMRGWSSCL